MQARIEIWKNGKKKSGKGVKRYEIILLSRTLTNFNGGKSRIRNTLLKEMKMKGSSINYRL